MKLRIYPSACMSAYCGKTKCPPTCKYLPALQEFKAWKQRTKAKQADPVWAPSVYEAQS